MSGLLIAQDICTRNNVYVRLLNGPKQNYTNILENCLGLNIVGIANYGCTEELVDYIVSIEAVKSE